jgi:acetylglutamate kinase
MNNFASPPSTMVVKFGGNAMAGPATKALLTEIAAYQVAGSKVVLVHGGGPEIDRELERRGIASERIEGQRVTSAEILAVTEAVLCGTLNKALVRACIAQGIPAVGISGQDGSLLIAEKLVLDSHADLGYVGNVVRVQTELLHALLDQGFMPVIAPLAVAADGSTAYNVNGDTSAGAIAGALHADAFFLVTNVDRIRSNPDNPSSGIESMTLRNAQTFYQSEACRQSMKPKLAAAIHAVEAGTRAAYICTPRENTIASALSGESTAITP